MQLGGVGRVMWGLAIACIVMSSGVFIWSVALFLVGLEMTPWHILLTPLLSLFVLKLTTYKDENPLTWPGLVFNYLFFVVVLSLLGYAANLNWAWSLADRSLQTELMLQFANGWNPFYESAGKLTDLAVGSAKGGALFQSAFYLYAGRFEMSQVHNLWFVFLLLLLAPFFFRALRPYGSTWHGVLLGMILCLNPVLLAQLWTGCIDALFVCCIQLLLMLGAMYCLDDKHRHRGWLGTGFLSLLFFTINVSTWGIFAVLALIVPLVVWQLFSQNKKAGAVSALVILIGFVLGVAMFGFDPYMKNIIEHGQLLYPLSLQSLQADTPGWLQGLNPARQFLYSTLANPASDYESARLATAWHFFALDDPLAYLHSDPRLRGFGILSPVLFLGALLLLPMLLLPAKESFHGTAVVRLVVLQLVLMTLVTPGQWWARLIGFAWMLIPMLIGYAGWQGFFQRTAAVLMMLLVLVNSGHYVLHAWPAQFQYAEGVEAYMARLTSGELPTDADAQRANADSASSPAWMELKRKGEGDLLSAALLPKVENTWNNVVNGRQLWEMQKQVVQNLDGK